MMHGQKNIKSAELGA